MNAGNSGDSGLQLQQPGGSLSFDCCSSVALEALEGPSSQERSDVAFFSELEILITAEVLLVSLECADCVSLLSEIRKKLKVPSGSLSLLLLLLIPGLMWRIKNASNWHWPGILAKIDEATLSRRSRAELLSQSLCLTVCSCRGSTYFV